MTELSKLRVSLTKHGAHKIYRLIEAFESKDVLSNTWDKYDGIKIDRAQAARNLSALPDGDIPAIWSLAKDRSTETLKRLVFLGILFSHHQLIEAFAKATTASARGRIQRGRVITGKAFTNLKNDLQELGLAEASGVNFVDYDLRSVMMDPLLPDLAAELIRLKFAEAKWDGTSSLLDECVRVKLHAALGIEEIVFRKWLTGAAPAVPDADELPEVTDPDKTPVTPFSFRSGHSTKKSGTAVLAKQKKHKPAKLLHNEIQNLLYDILVADLGAQNVGTELDSASFGTSIDLVTRHGVDFDFYEIKTSISIKKCLRQAIAQLLEYAYWPDQTRARRLIVVAEAKATTDAKKYLAHLRENLGLPLYYASIDTEKGKLSKLN